MFEVYQKRTFIEIDMNLRKLSAILSNVVFKQNTYYGENENKLQAKVDSQGADVTNRPVQYSKTARVILICFFQQNGFQKSLVEQLANDPNLLPYF